MAQVFIEYCDECDSSKQAFWRCDCNLCLCDKCKRDHVEDLKHTAVHIYEAEDDGIHPFCEVEGHGDRKKESYCRSCEKRICNKCMTSTNHKTHDICDVDDKIHELQNEIKGNIDIMIDKQTEIKRAKDKSKTQLDEIKDVLTETESDILKRKEKLISMINQLSQNYINELKRVELDAKAKQASCQRKCKNSITDIKNILTDAQNTQESGDIEALQNIIIREKGMMAKDPPTVTYRTPPILSGNDPLKHDVIKLLGKLKSGEDSEDVLQKHKEQYRIVPEKVNVVHVSSPSQKAVDQLLLSSDGKYVWLVYRQSVDLHKLSITGELILRSKAVGKRTITCTVLTSTGDILVGTGSQVKQVSQDGNVEDFCNSDDANHETRGLAIDPTTGNVLVCFYTSKGNFPGAVLTVFSTDGKERIESISLFPQGDAVIQDPQRIACNASGHIGVIDKLPDYKSLKFLDVKGQHISSFSGRINNRKEHRIHLNDLEPNDESSFFVCDVYNKIFIIDKNGEGHFIFDVWDKSKKNTCSIALDPSQGPKSRRKVVVGCQDGTLLFIDGIETGYESLQRGIIRVEDEDDDWSKQKNPAVTP